MNHRQQLFANTYLRHNDPTIAYMEAYKPKAPNYRAIMSAANRLLRKPEIAEYISSVRDSVRSQLEYELKEKMMEEALTVHEKRLYIKRVINGEILIPQDYKTTGCNRCTMFIRPTFPQILGYLKEDSRLAGHYPDKRRTSTRQQTTTSNISCPPLAGVSASSDGGGALAPDTREEQQKTTTERSELAVTIEKDINPTTTDNKKSISDTESPRNLSRNKQEGDRGTLAPDTHEEQKTTNNNSPRPGAPMAIGIEVSHAGLRKLIEKQRQRNTRKTAPL